MARERIRKLDSEVERLDRALIDLSSSLRTCDAKISKIENIKFFEPTLWEKLKFMFDCNEIYINFFTKLKSDV